MNEMKEEKTRDFIENLRYWIRYTIPNCFYIFYKLLQIQNLL